MVRELGKDNLATHLKNNSWTLRSFGLPSDPYGYYTNGNATVFAATKGDTLAIAFRGADQPSNPQDIGQTLEYVQDLAAAPNPLLYYSRLVPFIDAAISSANSDPSIKKILVTGASLGGEMADLWATNPRGRNTVIPGSKFNDHSNVSVVTFGSPGIPPGEVSSQPLIGTKPNFLDRVLDLHNSTDPVYNHAGLTGEKAALLSVAGSLSHSFGTQKTFYTPTISASTWITHNPAFYKAEIDALKSSTLFDSSNAQTVFVFDFNSSNSPPQTTIDVNNTNLGIPKGPHFLVGLAGADTLIGAPGDSILAWSGTHTLTGGGAGLNKFEVITGNDTITNYQYPRDLLTLHSNVHIPGVFTNGPDPNNPNSPSGVRGTLLTYTQADQKPGMVFLPGTDLGPVASQIPWLDWRGTSLAL